MCLIHLLSHFQETWQQLLRFSPWVSQEGRQEGREEGGKEAGANGLSTQEGTSPSSPGPRTAKSLLSSC